MQDVNSNNSKRKTSRYASGQANPKTTTQT